MSSNIRILVFSALSLFAVSVNAKVVTEKTAASVAKNFMVSNGLTQELVVFQPADDQMVYKEKTIDAPAYHLFIDKNHKNLVIVSGDDIARPILGYCFNSQNDGNSDLPPAMKDWLNEMERQISYARKNGIVQNSEMVRQWGDPGVGNVVKQLNTAQWQQNSPYNLQCPLQNDGNRCITGCVATAYAILMKYYGYPSSGKGITPAYICTKSGVYVQSRDLNHSYNWSSMPLTYSSDKYIEFATNVAQLMADIGAAIQADYANSETSANYSTYSKSALFSHFGYYVGKQYKKANYAIEEWYTKLKEQLDMDRPVLYRGEHEDAGGGHAFIIDGYTDQDYFCINWGWGGNHNGAFALDALNPGTYTYNSEQAAFFDFQPAASLPTVAIANEIECPTLETAIGIAPLNGTLTQIKMIENDTINDIYIQDNQNIELDLNGCTIGIEQYGFYNHGNLNVSDSKGNGKIIVTSGNTSVLNNYNVLSIDGGDFINKVALAKGEKDYRRCIWTAAESATLIKGGRFTSISQTICSNGLLTIDNGEFECIGTSAVISNYSTSDTLSINGGTFKNLTNPSENSNYCRTLWTCDGSVTNIKSGLFICKNGVLCSNGELTIDDGRFECTGNHGVVNFYSKTGLLTINGGTFINSLKDKDKDKEQPEYRRAVWADEGSKTHITNGYFSCDYQVMTFVGDAVVDGATIDNTGNGVGILSVANVVVNYCKLRGTRLLGVGAKTGSSIKCYGGIYSQKVDNSFLGTDCKCVSNDDDNTNSTYPFKVVNTNPSEVKAIMMTSDAEEMHYDLNGIKRSDNYPGLHIIHRADGKNIKVIYK